MDKEDESLIETDPDAGSQPEAQREPTARELAMAAIQVQREVDEDAAPTQTDPPANQGSEATSSDEQQLAAQLEAPQLLATNLDKTMVRVKVDGVETEVPVSEVVRSYQKQSAADRRLAEANRLLEAAKNASPPVGLDPHAPPKDTAHQPEPTDSKTEAKAFLDALYGGDEEVALAAVEKILGSGRTNGPTLDPDQLAAKLTPVVRQQLIDDSALERFAQANADIANDPHLVQMTNGFIQAEVDGGMPYHEALDAGAKRTRDWLASIGAATAAPPTTVRNSKLERKIGIDEIAGLNKTAASGQEPVQTPSQVIEGMRKARGLPV